VEFKWRKRNTKQSSLSGTYDSDLLINL
jgi:coiled-coil domain-containing protein 61